MRARTLVALAWVTLAGCAPEDTLPASSEALAEDAIDAQESLGVAVVVSGLPGLVVSSDATILAEAVAAQANIGQVFDDPSCIAVTIEGNVVTYELDGCSGPWGQTKISGTEISVFAPGGSAGSFAVESHSVALRVNGKDASHEGSIVISATPDERRLTWAGSYDGFSRGGIPVHLEADMTLTITADRVALEGTSSSSIGLRGLDVTIDGYRRGPAGTCPAGVIHAERKLAKLAVDLSFDETPLVVATNDQGDYGTLEIECSPPAD
ncbi:MAG: hypothetical protein U0271_16925 [Polyangiaceae bacterium]